MGLGVRMCVSRRRKEIKKSPERTKTHVDFFWDYQVVRVAFSLGTEKGVT